MNKKQKNNVLLSLAMWCIIFSGVAISGVVSAKNVLMVFLWLLFLSGALIVLFALDKYIVFKVKEIRNEKYL